MYARGIYSVTDALQLGFNVYWTDSFLNSGANGTYASGTLKYTFPAFSNGVAVYTSGEFGYQWLGTTDAFYGPDRCSSPAPASTTRTTPLGTSVSASPTRC